MGEQGVDVVEGRTIPPASWWRRLAAYLLDTLSVGVSVGAGLLAVWLFGSWIAFPVTMIVSGAVFAAVWALSRSSIVSDFLSEFDGCWLTLILLVIVVIVLIVSAAGCWVLWLPALEQGQTPGKAALSIRTVDVASAETVSWGRMLLREFAVKGVVWWAGIAATMFLGGGSVVTGLWIALTALCTVSVLWCLVDDNKQTLHDKVMGTTIVREKKEYAPKS